MRFHCEIVVPVVVEADDLAGAYRAATEAAESLVAAGERFEVARVRQTVEDTDSRYPKRLPEELTW